MSRRPKLTQDEKDQIVALRQKGWSLERLAEKFKCHVGSISWCCLMAGVTSPGGEKRKRRDYDVGAPQYLRHGKPVRRYSPEEDKLILEMRERGESIAAICRATKRRHNSIVGRLCSIARWEEQKESDCQPSQPLLEMAANDGAAP